MYVVIGIQQLQRVCSTQTWHSMPTSITCFLDKPFSFCMNAAVAATTEGHLVQRWFESLFFSSGTVSPSPWRIAPWPLPESLAPWQPSTNMPALATSWRSTSASIERQVFLNIYPTSAALA